MESCCARFRDGSSAHAWVPEGTEHDIYHGSVGRRVRAFNVLVQMGDSVMFTDAEGKVSFPCIKALP